jgi:formate hydrogenlyase transcriptional activator
MPTAEALATGKPVLVRNTELARYNSPEYRRFVDLGCKSACSVPLITSKGTLGTLEIARTTSDGWPESDVDFLVQVATQIAIAIEGASPATGGEGSGSRPRVTLEDVIRLDHNNGNMIGEGAAFQSILKGVHIVAPTDATVPYIG